MILEGLESNFSTRKLEGNKPLTVLLDLRPELEAKALEEAAAQGLGLQEYLQTVVEEALHAPRARSSVSLAEFDRIMDEFAKDSESLPSPPVFDRAMIYDDHD